MSEAEASPLERDVAGLAATEGVTWAPIRHHSPRCAQQLRALIARVRPDVVLVEAPAEGEALLPQLTAPDTSPPVALFLYAQEPAPKGSRSSEAPARRHRCYVPFAAMSPEWVAIQEASRRETPVRFMDLPFHERVAAELTGPQTESGHEPVLNDDHLLARADPLPRLLERSGCRDFDEWWDRSFESGATHSEPGAYFDDLQRFSSLMRRSDGTLDALTQAREQYMAATLKAERDAGRHCLVVTGGYHCLGIAEQLAQPAGEPERPTPPAHGVHLIAYSLDRLQQASGYAAGLPDCGYYQAVWAKMARQRPPARPYTEVNRELTHRMNRQLRADGQPATLPDAVEAATMAERLGQLRGVAAGRPELRDAVVSCFVKQARDDRETAFDASLERTLRTQETGRVPQDAPTAPLVADFRQQCQQLGLPCQAAEPVNKELALYRHAHHRRISQFLHQLAYLGVPYAEHQAGPDLAAGRELHRVREKWQLCWRVETEATLTERSHYGSTLAEAALKRAMEAMADADTSGPERIVLLLQALRMGLHQLLEPIRRDVEQWVATETQVLRLVTGVQRLIVAEEAHSALASGDEPSLAALRQDCYERACLRLPWVGQLSDEQAAALADGLVGLYGLTLEAGSGCDPELLFDSANRLWRDPATAPALRGVAGALATISGRSDDSEVAEAIDTAFAPIEHQPDAVGEFMQGFLRLARERFLQATDVQARLTEWLASLDEDVFLAALPALRRAFTLLSPREKQRLGQSLWGESAPPAPARAWDTDSLGAAAALQKQLISAAEPWALPVTAS